MRGEEKRKERCWREREGGEKNENERREKGVKMEEKTKNDTFIYSRSFSNNDSGNINFHFVL